MCSKVKLTHMSCRAAHVAINPRKIRSGVMLPKDDLFQTLNHALLEYITFSNEKFKQLF